MLGKELWREATLSVLPTWHNALLESGTFGASRQLVLIATFIGKELASPGSVFSVGSFLKIKCALASYSTTLSLIVTELTYSKPLRWLSKKYVRKKKYFTEKHLGCCSSVSSVGWEYWNQNRHIPLRSINIQWNSHHNHSRITVLYRHIIIWTWSQQWTSQTNCSPTRM